MNPGEGRMWIERGRIQPNEVPEAPEVLDPTGVLEVLEPPVLAAPEVQDLPVPAAPEVPGRPVPADIPAQIRVSAHTDAASLA